MLCCMHRLGEVVGGSAVLLARLQMTCSEWEAKYWGLTAETVMAMLGNQ